MTQFLFPYISLRNRKLLRCAAWSLLVLLVLMSLPFVFHLVNRGIDWMTDLFHSQRPWEEPLWFL